MRRIWPWLAILAAIAIATAPPRADAGPPGAPDTVALRGVLLDESGLAPSASTLVMVEAIGGAPGEAALAGSTLSLGDSIAITDDHGRFELRARPGTYTLLASRGERSATIVERLELRADTELAPIRVVLVPDYTCALPIHIPDPLPATAPRFGLTIARHEHLVPISRDRTHRAWIAPVVAADARTAVTTVEGGRRLHGAPGIPLAFVQYVQSHTLRAPIALPAGAGGATEVALRSGSNTLVTDARLVLGADRPAPAPAPAIDLSGALEGLAAGPLARDKAWLTAGISGERDALGRTGAHGLAALSAAPSSTHRLSLVGLAQATPEGARDHWAAARWSWHPLSSQVQLDAIATAEALEHPAAAALLPFAAHPAAAPAPAGERTRRLGGALSASLQPRALRHHRFFLSAGGGAGDRGGSRHTDASLAAADTWQLRPSLTLDAGLRWETRALDAARAAVLAPRASLTYDFTREHRADLFLAYQRTPLLDDAAPGRWAARPALARDDVAAGAVYSPYRSPHVMLGAAVRARRSILADTAPTADTAAGVEAWLRIDHPRTQLHAAASTLDRAASLVAWRLLSPRDATDQLSAAATLRASHTDGTTAGAALQWRRRPRPAGTELGVALEAYAGAGGPGARLVAGITR